MILLDDLCRRVQRLNIARVIIAATNVLKVLVNRQVQVNRLICSMIFGFEVCGYDFTVYIDQMLKDITTRNYK